MENEANTIDIIITKQLAGEATPDESNYLDTWKKVAIANQTYFDQLEKIWIAATPVDHTASWYDTEAALLHVKNEILDKTKSRIIRLPIIKYVAYAAALVTMAWGLNWVFQNNKQALPSVVLTSTSTIFVDTLNDGSIITLNRKSGLTLSNNYNKKERRMRLEGEGYFEVSPNKTKPFIVEVDQITVQAIGTAFNIDHKNPDLIHIMVTEGIVKIGGADHSMQLMAGEQATYTLSTKTLQKQTQPMHPNALAYKSKVFNFDTSPLSEVIRTMNVAYNIHVSLEPKTLERCVLTARYNNLDYHRVLELIAASFSFDIDKVSRDTIVLRGVGCNE